ncbi:MAG: hypothetical protein ISQ46_03890 [Methylophilaceae bacterium]|nr:hypothetical protein [Methylophilaceae bacterium]
MIIKNITVPNIEDNIKKILSNGLKEIDYNQVNEETRFTKVALPSFVHHKDVREIRKKMHAEFLRIYQNENHIKNNTYIEQIPGNLICGSTTIYAKTRENIYTFNDPNIQKERFIYAIYIVEGTCSIKQKHPQGNDNIPIPPVSYKKNNFIVLNIDKSDSIEYIHLEENESIILEFWWKLTTMQNGMNKPKPWIRYDKTKTILRNEHLEYIPSLRTILNEQDLFPEVSSYPKYPELIVQPNDQNLHDILKYVPQTRKVGDGPICHHAYALLPRRYFHFGLNKIDPGRKYIIKYEDYTKEDLDILIPKLVQKKT